MHSYDYAFVSCEYFVKFDFILKFLSCSCQAIDICGNSIAFPLRLYKSFHRQMPDQKLLVQLMDL